MHYAIIAAGEGSRLAQEGVSQPKPLVPLCGMPMVQRLLEIFVHNQADFIAVIVNDRMTEVHHFLLQWQESHPEVPMRILVRTTPSSMHSLAALCQILPDGPFVCTTVDTVFRPAEFARYVSQFAASAAEAARSGQRVAFSFGVTSFVDDEKPLWVSTSADGWISAFTDAGPAPYVSGGIYGMVRESVMPVLSHCLASGQSRMRNFQRALLQEGIPVRAFVFDKVMDIDHKSDIQKAEQWLA